MTSSNAAFGGRTLERQGGQRLDHIQQLRKVWRFVST
jgi:hypothetical protein